MTVVVVAFEGTVLPVHPKVVNIDSEEVAEFENASFDTALKLYVVQATRFVKLTLCEVTRGLVSVSEVVDANEFPVEYTTLVDANSLVVHVIVAEVEATLEVATFVMTGAVTSDVVKAHVVDGVIPSNRLFDPSLNAVPGTIT